MGRYSSSDANERNCDDRIKSSLVCLDPIGKFEDSCFKKNLFYKVNMIKKYDYLLVGAGLFSATFAYRATQAGKKCGSPEKTCV